MLYQLQEIANFLTNNNSENVKANYISFKSSHFKILSWTGIPLVWQKLLHQSFVHPEPNLNYFKWSFQKAREFVFYGILFSNVKLTSFLRHRLVVVRHQICLKDFSCSYWHWLAEVLEIESSTGKWVEPSSSKYVNSVYQDLGSNCKSNKNIFFEVTFESSNFWTEANSTKFL